MPEIDPHRSGDLDHAALYSAVDNVMTMWEATEEAVATLFLILARPNDAHSAQVVKSSLQQSRVRPPR